MRVHLVPFILPCFMVTPATAQVPAVSDWRAVIEQVQKAGGWKAYLREAQTPEPISSQKRPVALLSLADATRMVQARTPEISQRLTGIDPNNPSWRQLTPEQRHALIAHHRMMDELKRQFYAAYAAQESSKVQADVYEVSMIAAELSLRMRKAGNLNALHLLEEKLKAESALTSKMQAEDRVIQEQERLFQLIGFAKPNADVQLISETTVNAKSASETRGRLESLLAQAAIAKEAPAMDLIEQQSKVRQALSRHAARLKQYEQYQTRILPMRQQMLDEAVLQYNGMIIGVFDLLKEAEHLLQARQKSIQALSDLMVSESELALELALLNTHLDQIGQRP
ncbi:MAG: hypothetical protein RJA58_415 [Pseudomonadota bacterium]